MYVKVPAARPSDGSFVTLALGTGALLVAALTIAPIVPADEDRASPAYAGLFAVGEERETLMLAHPSAAKAVLVVAVLLGLWSCVRVARTPAGTPPSAAPAFAAAGLAVGLIPWMGYTGTGESGIAVPFGEGSYLLTGWDQLGWLGWLLVAAGVALAAAGARARPPVAVVLVPVLAAGLVLLGALAVDPGDGLSVVPAPALLPVLAALGFAFAVAWRLPAGSRSGGDRRVADTGCAVLAASVVLPWSFEGQAFWLPDDGIARGFVVAAAVAGGLGIAAAPRGAIRLAATAAVVVLTAIPVERVARGPVTGPGAYVAVAAGALVCAVLLRRPQRGGTL